MASAAAAQAPPAPPPAQPDWLTLPHELLQRCLSHLADKRAAFSSCRRFARAVLLSSLQQERPALLDWDVDRAEPFAPSARLVQALVGEQASKGVTLELYSEEEGSPEQCLAELAASGVALACVTRLEMQGLSLDTLIADGTSTLLPNLRQLCISECQLTAAAVDSLVDTTCGRLQHVEVEGLQGERTHLTIQLQQLAFLPSLSSVSLLDSTCPTSFLGLLGARLTALHLDKSYRQRSNRSPTWRATLAHVARCTALQSLAIPCATSEELGLVAPALQRLRRLHLNGPSTRVDGDAMVERLLGLPHLTSLRWEDSHAHSFQRSHASSPCGWRELSFGSIAPHQLARLPLHSLTSPVAWDIIILEERRASVADVRAAVDNVARRCPAGSAWRRPREDTWPTLHFMALNGPTFTRGGGEGDTPAVLLRALQPLLAAPGLRQLVVVDLAWDVELVLALGEVLPRTCTGLFLMDGSLALPACLQLAKGLPWLQALVLSHMHVHPHAVSAYVGSAASTQGGVLPCGRPRLTLVRVVRPLCPEGVRDEAHWRDWEQVRDAVVGLGVGVELSLAL